jgi:hypothetical protein
MLGLPGEQGLEPIFDGMLIPFILQFLGNSRPLLAIQPDKLDQDVIFLLQPVLLQLRWVQMVQPSLPTLFRCAEILPLGLDEKSLPEIAPLESEIIPSD